MQLSTALIFDKLLSERTKKKTEKFILVVAIISFLVHLLLIYLKDFKIIHLRSDNILLTNPISAIYTPFSFILLYEVYLLIYYLSKSITIYIGKQYEIITLIIIRRVFKDLSILNLSSDWFHIKDDLKFTYDIVASLLLFYLLYFFYAKSYKKNTVYNDEKVLSVKIRRYVIFKKIISIILIPILLGLSLYSFTNWTIDAFLNSASGENGFRNINNIFFDEFFKILIIVDVLVLLMSLFYTSEFHKVMRNSGFIISTILIRLSFSVEGIINTLLIVSSVIFGLSVLLIHNKYEKSDPEKEPS
ncbi:MAG: hypothetical protein H7320_24450 [Ferruginibacter sp.]|nr:hypothetical protein [Ferruginibacter sp.]